MLFALHRQSPATLSAPEMHSHARHRAAGPFISERLCLARSPQPSMYTAHVFISINSAGPAFPPPAGRDSPRFPAESPEIFKAPLRLSIDAPQLPRAQTITPKIAPRNSAALSVDSRPLLSAPPRNLPRRYRAPMALRGRPIPKLPALSFLQQTAGASSPRDTLAPPRKLGLIAARSVARVFGGAPRLAPTRPPVAREFSFSHAIPLIRRDRARGSSRAFNSRNINFARTRRFLPA